LPILVISIHSSVPSIKTSEIMRSNTINTPELMVSPELSRAPESMPPVWLSSPAHVNSSPDHDVVVSTSNPRPDELYHPVSTRVISCPSCASCASCKRSLGFSPHKSWAKDDPKINIRILAPMSTFLLTDISTLGKIKLQSRFLCIFCAEQEGL
jgi:hypothetical protein